MTCILFCYYKSQAVNNLRIRCGLPVLEKLHIINIRKIISIIHVPALKSPKNARTDFCIVLEVLFWFYDLRHLHVTIRTLQTIFTCWYIMFWKPSQGVDVLFRIICGQSIYKQQCSVTASIDIVLLNFSFFCLFSAYSTRISNTENLL